MFKKITYYLMLSMFITVSKGSVTAAPNDQNSVLKTDKVKPVPVKSFKHTDIGNPALAGTVKIAGGGFDITAGGADVWGVKDEFNYVYVERNGDFDLISRIESLSSPHLYTKAGLMAREDLTPGSRHIYFQVFPDNNPRNKNNGGFEFQYRREKGGEMKAIYPESSVGTPEFPVAYPNTWIRLKRVGDVFTGYWSSDGNTWKVYTSFTLELPSKIFLGLAVTSHNTKETATAKFRNIGEPAH